ncbi:hypothetical protein EMCG_05907 [[Emmonsia] crescens]|uniref:Prion-inhibition and propagation HeLo domain-containing protein n=1 Tax=[Emmonsia] crescens TaxID=73230 RepID=A0A0G2ID03_9EURO|nr:hypothetical protein EMCG_05907 [Emmonsia crescens UAMH 3008]
MAEFALWSPIVSFLTLIEYINGLAGAQGEMRTADDILNCTSDLLTGVKHDFERLQDYLSRSRKRYAQRQIDRTGKELKKAQEIINVNKDHSTGIRRIKDIGWVLKNKAEFQTCLTALHQYHITLSQIRLELAFLESTVPWAVDRFTLEPGTFSYPCLGQPVDINKRHRMLAWAEDDYPNDSQYTHSTSQPQQRLLAMPSLSYGSNSFTNSPRYSDPEDLGTWLLHRHCDNVRMRN